MTEAPARVVVRIRAADEATARTLAAALDPENEGYVRVRVEQATLVAEADAADPGALLHTLDDLLASLSAAEKVLASKP